MKIVLVVFRFFPYGGLERDMLRIAECAANRGHLVTVLTTKWEGDIPDGIEIRFVRVSAWSNHAKMREFERLVQPVLPQFDVSIAFNRIPGCDFYFAADDCYAVSMAKKHSCLALRCLPRYRSFLDQEKRIFAPGGSTRIFTLTRRQKGDYQKNYGTEEVRFTELPPGIDPRCVRSADAEARRAAKRRELHLSEQEKMIFLAGSNFVLKGADRAIAALAALPEAEKSRAHFFFAGQSNADLMMKLAAKLGVADRVVPLGARRDVPDLLLAADFAVLFSRSEATGTFLAEAIAAGCPVISSDACGFAPLVAASGGGVVPEPFDQKTCNQLLYAFLAESNLHRHHAVDYAQHVDFTRRAEAAVSCIEEFVRRLDKQSGAKYI